MASGTPVVASRIGGIQDQISDGETGVLIDDPCDLAEFGHAVAELIEDPERSRRLGEAAKERVRTDFLHTTHLMHYLSLFEKMLAV
jgi:trehalose synthase